MKRLFPNHTQLYLPFINDKRGYKSEYEDKQRQLFKNYQKEAKARLSDLDQQKSAKKSQPKEFYKTTLEFSDKNQLPASACQTLKKEYASDLQKQISDSKNHSQNQKEKERNQWKNANSYVSTLEKDFASRQLNQQRAVRKDYQAFLAAQSQVKESQKIAEKKEKLQLAKENLELEREVTREKAES